MRRILRRQMRRPFQHMAGLRVSQVSALSTSLILDLDARFGVTLAGSDVSAWADGAGAANNFSEATNRPAYTTADSNWGGRPSIAYTAANTDRLISSDAASTWKFLHDGTGMTVAAVCRPTLAANAGRLFNTYAGTLTAIGFMVQYSGASQRWDLSVGNGVASLTTSQAINGQIAGNKCSVVVCFNSSLSTDKLIIYVNGNRVAGNSGAFTPSTSDPIATARVGINTAAGATSAFGGEINAVHAWTRYFTAADAALYHAYAIDNYL